MRALLVHRPSCDPLLPPYITPPKRSRRRHFYAVAVLLCLAALVALLGRWVSRRPLSAGAGHLSRVAIVMHNSADQEIFHDSVANHRRYAQIHGYAFNHSNSAYLAMGERPLFSGAFKSSGEDGYNKPVHVMHVISEGLARGNVEWLFFADSDTWILQPDIRLESFLPPPEMDFAPSEEPFFIATTDAFGMNSGIYFLRFTYWAHSFLAQALSELYSPERHLHYSDQRTISRLFRDDPTLASHLWLLDQSSINHYPASPIFRPSDEDQSDKLVRNPASPHTLQVHMVDRLKEQPVFFQETMADLAGRWAQAAIETAAALSFYARWSLSQEHLLRLAPHVLTRSEDVRRATAVYWKHSAANKGSPEVRWLDVL